MDLGECPKIHDLALRADYANATKDRDYFYDIDVSYFNIILHKYKYYNYVYQISVYDDITETWVGQSWLVDWSSPKIPSLAGPLNYDP